MLKIQSRYIEYFSNNVDKCRNHFFIDSEKKNEQKEKWFFPTYFLNLPEVFQRADR